MPFGSVAYLEGDALGKAGDGEEMEVVDRKILLVGCLGVVAMGHIEDIVGDILLDYKPWTATEAESLALTDGVEPQTLVATSLTRLRLPRTIPSTSTRTLLPPAPTATSTASR